MAELPSARTWAETDQQGSRLGEAAGVPKFAYAIQLPQSDIAEGRVAPGGDNNQSRSPLSGPPMRVLVADTMPQDAYAAVSYGNRWYWIANTDIESKATFAVIMLLFSIAETGTKGAAPVVTIPANQ
jgi:hypothetical protein